MIEWKRRLADDLTHGFILREYQAQTPAMTATFEQDAIHRYRTDNIFHARVTSLVAGVMEIVGRRVDEAWAEMSREQTETINTLHEALELARARASV